MKIAINLFDISKIGGIMTVHTELKNGLQKNGHVVDDYWISLNTTRLPERTSLPEEMRKCTGILGFLKSEWITEYKRKMEEYDIIIFTHPCPTEASCESRKWQELYIPEKRNIVIWHDPIWKDHYPWIQEVFPKIDKIACIQEKAYYSLVPEIKAPVRKSRSLFDDDNDVPQEIKPIHPNIIICNHPLNLDNMGLYKDKKEKMVLSSQFFFKAWKNVDKFIRAIPQINGDINVEISGLGTDYYYMAGSEKNRAKMGNKFKNSNDEYIWDVAIKHSGFRHIIGMGASGGKTQASKSVVEDAFVRAKCVVDLSVGESGTKTGYRSMNYVVLEAIKYGCVPIVRMQSILEKIWSPLDFYIVEEPDLVNSTARAVNEICNNFENYEQMIFGSQKKLKEYYSNEIVAQKVIS